MWLLMTQLCIIKHFHAQSCVHMCVLVSVSISWREIENGILPSPSGFILHFENRFTRLWLLPILGLFSCNRINRSYFSLVCQFSPSSPPLFFFPQKLHLKSVLNTSPKITKTFSLEIRKTSAGTGACEKGMGIQLFKPPSEKSMWNKCAHTWYAFLPMHIFSQNAQYLTVYTITMESGPGCCTLR